MTNGMGDHHCILGYVCKMLTLRTEGFYGSKVDDPQLQEAAILRGGSWMETQGSCETERHVYLLYLCYDRIF